MSLYDVTGTQCPLCKEKMELAGSITDDGPPQPGDVTSCYFCGAAMVFNDDMSIRHMGVLEYVKLPHELRRMLIARWMVAKASRRQGPIH